MDYKECSDVLDTCYLTEGRVANIITSLESVSLKEFMSRVHVGDIVLASGRVDASRKNKIKSKGNEGKNLNDTNFKGKDSNSVINDTILTPFQSDSVQIGNKSYADTIEANQRLEVDTLKAIKLNGLSISHEMIYNKNRRKYGFKQI